jgi:hypothetical protein
MMCKRIRQAASCVLAGLGATISLLAGTSSTRADVVTDVSTLSQANRLSLFHDYSMNVVGLTAGNIPGSVGSGMFDSFLDNGSATAPSDTDRSYTLSATPFTGFDSNAEARRSADVQSGVFGGVDLSAVYRINIGPNDPTVGSPTQFQFAYDTTAAAYEGTVFKADPFQQTLSGSYRRSLFNDSLFVGFALNDQFTLEHGEAFLNTFDASPSVEWFVAPQESIEVSYDYTRLGYFINHIGVPEDPDANRHTINTRFHFYSFPQLRGDIPESPDQLGDILRATLRRATIGYAAVINNATGHDYEYEANRLSVGFEGVHLIPRIRNIFMDVSYAHEWDNYMNTNFEGPIVIAGKPPRVRRKDHVDVFTLRVNGRLLDLPQDRGTLGTFFQCDLIGDRSNIFNRHYNESIVSGGLTYQW